MLNACRHQRSVHVMVFSRFANAFVCSTPVGIKDRFTRVRRRCRGRGWCAQRLSASKIGSLDDASTDGTHQMCSTPVGIKDRFTDRSGRPLRRALSAQRLSASKIGSPARRRGAQTAAKCSTPVGIKDRFTQRAHGSPLRVLVLNACRHQRSVHSIGCRTIIFRGRVLNACRHQRSVHPLLVRAFSESKGAQRLSASKIGSLYSSFNA